MATAKATIATFDQLTSLSREIDAKAKSVTLINGFQKGPELIQSYCDLAKQATSEYEKQTNAGDAKYTSQEQTSVNEAFTKFADSLVAALSTTIGKRGILESVGNAYQVAATLRNVEEAADTVAFATTMALEGATAASATEKKKNMDKVLQQAISTFADGLP